MSKRVAVIDIGSNTIKLLVAERTETGEIRAVHMRTIDARISKGISAAQPFLGESGMQAGVAAVESLLADVDAHQPCAVQLVATSAVRDAANGPEFQDRVLQRTGHPIRILSGHEEANLIGRGLRCDKTLRSFTDFYVFDLGGGSLEFLSFRNASVEQAFSLPLGCVRMTERYVPDPTRAFTKEVDTRIREETRQAVRASSFRFNLPSTAQAVFAGGTMTTVRAIFAQRQGVSLLQASPVVSVPELEQLLSEVGALPLASRQAIPGLPPARADVFPTALATILAVAELGEIRSFHHSMHNLRWGVASMMLA